MISTIRKCAGLAGSALVLFAGLSAEASGQMAIPGQFEVSPVGAATFTIPIVVPPGVAGMEPKLALTYNSRAGNGVLGVGWSLTGLPAITRCRRTAPQDGTKGSVAYDANDRFCLGGQRLMLLPGRTYGESGSSYRTEIESFSKVTALGSAGSGPQYFVIKTKDGQTMEFGNTSDSRVLVTGTSTVRYWALNKVIDGAGNAQNIVYASSGGAISTAHPVRILYTSNDARGLASANAVEFQYTDRPDVLGGYVGGYPYSTPVRLSSVVTKTNGSIVSTYTLNYELGVGGRSVVTSLSLCAPSGLCTTPTRFGMGGVIGNQAAGPSVVLPVSQTESSTVGGRWKVLDANADGRTDLIHLTSTPGAYRAWLSNGDGTFSIREHTTTVDATDLSLGQWEILDIDGDGLTDFIHFTPTQTYAWRSNGDGSFSITVISLTDDTAYNQGRWVGIDVNGDGLGDLVHLTVNAGEEMRVWRSNGDGTFTPTRFSGGGSSNFYSGKWEVADVNGDGLADLVQFELTDCAAPPVNVNMNVWKSRGNGAFDKTTSLLQTASCVSIWPNRIPPSFQVRQLDVNADGFVDFLFLYTPPVVPPDQYHSGNPSPGTARVITSKGDGTFNVATVPTPPDAAEMSYGNWDVVDVDGDGLDDVVHSLVFTPVGGTPQTSAFLWRSNGNGTFLVSPFPVACPTSGCGVFRAGDFGGSGAPAFVGLNPSTSYKEGSSVKSIWFLSSPLRNIATSVANGLGGSTTWQIRPLPTILGTSYFKEIASNSTRWTVATPIPVVTVARNNSGWVHDSSQTSLDRSTYFSYGSARVERNGRGFLGFNWLQSTDSATGLSTRRYFSQDFPFIGRVVAQGSGLGASLDGTGGSWNNINLTTTEYSCTSLDGNSGCSVSPGKRYFVYPAQVDTQTSDIDGTALPRTRVVNSEPTLFGDIGVTNTTTLNPDGSPTEYSKRVENVYYNDDATWIIGRLIRSTVTTRGPDIPAPITPGSGGLPPAVAPALPAKTTAALMAILQLLLGDD